MGSRNFLWLLFLYVLIFLAVLLVLILVVKKEKKATILDLYFQLEENLKKVKNFHEPANGSTNDKVGNINIIVINLPRSQKRIAQLLKEFKKFEIKNFQVMEAVDGRKIPNVNLGYIDLGYIPKEFSSRTGPVKFKNNGNISQAELGCTLSHIKAMLQVYQGRSDYSLICEDDISFTLLPLWSASIEDIIKRAPEGWEIISLYTTCLKPKIKEYLEYDKFGCWGTVGYVINKKGCSKILNKLFQNSVLTLDKNLSPHGSTTADLFLMGLANSYCYHQSLFLPINLPDTESTIHKDHGQGHIKEAINIIKSYVGFMDQNPSNF